MSLLSLQNISKSFGAGAVVNSLSLEIERGEFYGLLGPSGCGKTTVLRMIAGLIAPDAGRIFLDGRDITRLAPELRGFGMVFQAYALFPHLNVLENVAFGLRARRLEKTEIANRVKNALELVQLQGYGHRRISELSGGQQQRVAIARAIAVEPKLLLFDEPLSNLDIALREETRRELRELVLRLNLTALYVTHDQEEAFALCDRIAVMFEGRLLQTGQPRELYEHPSHLAVARFLGRNNLIAAMRLSSSKESRAAFKTQAGAHTIVVSGADASQFAPLNKLCTLAIRPEHLRLTKETPNGTENFLRARVSEISFTGPTTTIQLDANGLTLEALCVESNGLKVGDSCAVVLPSERVTILKG